MYTVVSRSRAFALVTLISLALAWSPHAFGVVKNWTGLGANANWSTSGNWSPTGAPANGDDLVFPGGAARPVNTNDLVGRGFESISFNGASGGYFLRGQPISLTNGLTVANTAGANTVDIDVTLGANQTFNVGTGGTLDVNGDINLNGRNLTVLNAFATSLDGAISGVGNLTKTSSGVLTIGGAVANTFSGTVTVTAGTVTLAKTVGGAVPGDLFIGDGSGADLVQLTAANQIGNASDVTIDAGATLDLLGNSDTIGTLTLRGGTVATAAGILTLGGNVTSLASSVGSVISGNLNLGSVTRTISVASGIVGIELEISANIRGTGGLTKTGAGLLQLTSSNSYSGLTTIQQGTVFMENSFGLGATNQGTIVENGASLWLTAANLVVNEGLTLNGTGSPSNGALNAGNPFSGTWAAPITLASDSEIGVYGPAATFTLSGVISGPGGLTKNRAGTLIFAGSGANSYSGPTEVVQGTLELAKVGAFAIANGSLTIGDNLGGVNVDIVRYIVGGSQLNASVPIVIYGSGLLDMNNFSDDIGALTFFGGDLQTGTGTATLAGNVLVGPSTNTAAIIGGAVTFSATRIFTVSNSPAFSADLVVNAAVRGLGGLTKLGLGTMHLTASNSYAGLTTVSAGRLHVFDDFGLGATNVGTTVAADANLTLEGGVHVGLEPLTLNGDGIAGSGVAGALASFTGSNSWAGAITLASESWLYVDTGDILNVIGPITGTGPLNLFGHTPSGTIIFSGAGANTYTGVTRVQEGIVVLRKSIDNGSIPGDLIIGLGTSFATVRTELSPQINNSSDVTIGDNGALDLSVVGDEAIGSLSGGGNVRIGPPFGMGVNHSSTATYNGVISGPGGPFSKSGPGVAIFTGDNTYSGLTTISGGTLVINGSQPSSPVQVNAAGTLAGSGVVGNLNVTNGTVRPGTSPGILTSSNVAFTAASDFFVEINGPTAGSGYDQLNVRGTNQLGGATLHVSAPYAPAQNDSFAIISNDGAEPVVGTFAGLPDGAAVIAGGNEYRIRYNAGGNDVRLIYTNNPTRLGPSFLATGGNGDFVLDSGECLGFTLFVTNISATPITGISAHLEARSSGFAITQPFSTFPDIPAGLRSSNSTPFQVSILPSLPCGEDIFVDLVLETASHGSFRLRTFMQTGTTGPAVRFDNNTPTPIPDLGTNNSTILVSGITTELRNISVSMHITHTAADDLDIQLISPNGTIVTLSSDNGATASDYGTSCIDTQRTTFSQSAATSITNASAPFVGTFRPEENLGAFFGLAGTDVNGTWTLRVIDDAGGAVGTLRCWSLMLSPAACGDGGGPCELCPEATIFGLVGTNSAVQTGRLTDNGVPSTCASLKACPGLFTASARFADAFTFVNEESNACITVSLQSTGSLFSVAYVGGYNPANICQNYLADIGRSTSDGGSNYSFNVLAGSEFVVVVHQVDPSDVGQYRLDVTGGSCRPRLHITQVATNRAVLDWTSAALGYALQSATSLSSPVWSPVAGTPIIINSKYTVTNTIPAGPANRFFRLRKP